MIRYLAQNPEPGWGMWYFLVRVRHPAHDGEPVRERLLTIGIGGYKGPPSRDGHVELEYATVDCYDAFGTYATVAVGIFVNRAFEDPRVTRIMAEHSPFRFHVSFEPLRYPSIIAFERNGFVDVGRGSHSGSIRFQRDRSQFPAVYEVL